MTKSKLIKKEYDFEDGSACLNCNSTNTIRESLAVMNKKGTKAKVVGTLWCFGCGMRNMNDGSIVDENEEIFQSELLELKNSLKNNYTVRNFIELSRKIDVVLQDLQRRFDDFDEIKVPFCQGESEQEAQKITFYSVDPDMKTIALHFTYGHVELLPINKLYPDCIESDDDD